MLKIAQMNWVLTQELVYNWLPRMKKSNMNPEEEDNYRILQQFVIFNKSLPVILGKHDYDHWLNNIQTAEDFLFSSKIDVIMSKDIEILVDEVLERFMPHSIDLYPVTQIRANMVRAYSILRRSLEENGFKFKKSYSIDAEGYMPILANVIKEINSVKA